MSGWLQAAARVFAAAGVVTISCTVASAQPERLPPEWNPANTGALTFRGGFDIPSVYVFRGIVQETDPAFTFTPYGHLLVTLAHASDGVPSAAVDVGVWHSLQTGSSGTSGPSRRLHYAENVDVALWLALPARLGLTTGFTAYTSPNAMFNTIKEVNIELSHADWFRPRALVAFELEQDGQADSGAKKGTYGELSAAPSLPVGTRVRVAVPVRIGFSLANYYELAGKDHSFGYAQAGGLLTLRLPMPVRFGMWSVHGGADFYGFGDAPKAFNQGDGTRVVASAGLSLTY
jgi:hypothetical protein